MNGFTRSCLIFNGVIIWLLGGDVRVSLKGKKGLKALVNASAGATRVGLFDLKILLCSEFRT